MSFVPIMRFVSRVFVSRLQFLVVSVLVFAVGCRKNVAKKRK